MLYLPGAQREEEELAYTARKKTFRKKKKTHEVSEYCPHHFSLLLWLLVAACTEMWFLPFLTLIAFQVSFFSVYTVSSV